MEIKIESAGALEGGDISVKIAVLSGDYSERKTFVITPSDWRDLKLVCGRELSKIEYDALEEAAQFRSALEKGFNLLEYGANSHAALERKLVRRGFSIKAALRAADYLGLHGYINENADSDSIIHSCIAKGYGSRRIILKLREKGYGDKVLTAAAEKLADIDFVGNCAGVIKKRCGKIPNDKDSRNRIVAAMVRYGYSFTEIRDAVRMLEDKA